MILKSEVFKIGRLIKPHGIKGEISFAFENDVFDRVDCPYLICLVDDIYVPFFVKEHRFKGQETALITFDNVDTEERAKFFTGLEVYFPRKYYEENHEIDYSWNYFIGFSVVVQNLGEIGKIEAIDELTMNTLFLIKKGSDEYIIPATEDFITKIDDQRKILYLSLPEGLLEQN